MSYTPEDQLLEKPLLNAINALEALRQPIFKRLKAGRSEWNQAHLDELRKLILATSDLQIILVELSENVR